MWRKAEFSAAITPVYSVTRSFKKKFKSICFDFFIYFNLFFNWPQPF